MALNPRISRYLAPSDSCISPFPGEDYYYPVSDSLFFFHIRTNVLQTQQLSGTLLGSLQNYFDCKGARYPVRAHIERTFDAKTPLTPSAHK